MDNLIGPRRTEWGTLIWSDPSEPPLEDFINAAYIDNELIYGENPFKPEPFQEWGVSNLKEAKGKKKKKDKPEAHNDLLF